MNPSPSKPLTDAELSDVIARFASGEYDYLSLETAGRLFATITELQADLENLTVLKNGVLDAVKLWAARAESAEAEVGRLRAELAKLIDTIKDRKLPFEHEEIEWAADDAKLALAPKEQP